jgi:hypothetical protein
MRVALRYLERGVPGKSHDVHFMHTICSKSGNECVPQIVEVEIPNPCILHSPFKADHHLTPVPSRPYGIEYQFFIRRVLAKMFQCFQRLLSERHYAWPIRLGEGNIESLILLDVTPARV